MHVDYFLGSDSNRLEWQIGNDEQPSLYAHRNHCPTATTGRLLLRPLVSPKDLHTCMLFCNCSTVQHNTTYCKNEVYSSNVQRKKFEMCVSELNTTQVHCLCLFTIHMCVCVCVKHFSELDISKVRYLCLFTMYMCACVCVRARVLIVCVHMLCSCLLYWCIHVPRARVIRHALTNTHMCICMGVCMYSSCFLLQSVPSDRCTSHHVSTFVDMCCAGQVELHRKSTLPPPLK